MKGWVYVITNRAMPGLAKIGYSTKDPELRARELNHTGSPHPYFVEYEMLVDEPYQIEQRTHKLLSTKREGKEWFRCSSEEAISAIKQIAGNAIINENFKGVERAKIIEFHQQEIKKEKERREQQRIERETEKRLTAAESSIRQKYQLLIEKKFPEKPLWPYWFWGVIISSLVGSIINPKASESSLFIVSILFGAIIGLFLREYFEEKRKKPSGYKLLEKRRDDDMEIMREIIRNGVLERTDLLDNWSSSIRVNFKNWVGLEVDGLEMAIITKKVEKLVNGLLTTNDCRKIAVAIKLQMYAKSPKQNIISMIINSHPVVITDKIAASIFDVVVES
jgi:hypothetical protein